VHLPGRKNSDWVHREYTTLDGTGAQKVQLADFKTLAAATRVRRALACKKYFTTQSMERMLPP
jgi:hypothetical protein